MPKSLRSVEDHVQDIVDARKKAASMRFSPLPEGTERVADILDASCAAVAASFESDGFRYAASSRRFSRKVGVFTHTVSFEPDAGNLSGAHVGVSTHLSVRSSALKAWRAKHGSTDRSDYLWVSQLGYLSPDYAYLKWELLDPATRAAEVEDIAATIRRLALPAFSVYDNQESLAANLLGEKRIIEVPHWAVEIAVWVGNKPAAQTIMESYFRQRPDQIALFKELLGRFRSNGAAIEKYGPTDQMARAVLAFALDDTKIG